MEPWRSFLRFDPCPPLLSSGDPALVFFTRCNLLDENPGPVEELWRLSTAARLVSRQQGDGSWRYPGGGKKDQPFTNYTLLETFRVLGELVEQFGFHRDHPAIRAAVEYVFSCQSEDGDLRGILGRQTMPYYHGALLEQVIHAGYGDDARVERGLRWLLDVRQADGGWMVPAQAVPACEKMPAFWNGSAFVAQPHWPSSHLATGMALRAFAAHPAYRMAAEVRRAAGWLKSRFFKADVYNDRKGPIYWTKFQYPFWWPNLLTALDSLAWIGYGVDDRDVQAGLEWFARNQEPDGLWPTGYGSGRRAEPMRQWVGLAVGRVLKRFME